MAMNGNLKIIQWLHANRLEGCKPETLRPSGNTSGIVKFLARSERKDVS